MEEADYELEEGSDLEFVHSRRVLRIYRAAVTFPALVAAAAYLLSIFARVFDGPTGTTYIMLAGMAIRPVVVTLISLLSLLLSIVFLIGGYLRFGWQRFSPNVWRIFTLLFMPGPKTVPLEPMKGGEPWLKISSANPLISPKTTDPTGSEQPPPSWADTIRDRLNDVALNAATMLKRLNTEVSNLGRRNNTNLTIGIGITVISIGALFYYVYEWQMHPLTKADLPWGMLNFVPRLSLVILIEIFAYFFLGLYRSGLAEVKYFQNEMTNLESKVPALRVTIEHKDVKTTAYVVTKLADTERNLVLRKGETTPEIEMSRLQREQLTKLVGELTKLTGRVQGGASSRKRKKSNDDDVEE